PAPLVAARAFGPGRLGPGQELVTFRQGPARSSGNSRALAAHVAFVRRLPQVAAVDPPAVSSGGRQVLLSFVPRSSPERAPARALLRELRAVRGSPPGIGRTATVEVGGNTALPQDFAGLISSSMWKIVVFV